MKEKQIMYKEKIKELEDLKTKKDNLNKEILEINLKLKTLRSELFVLTNNENFLIKDYEEMSTEEVIDNLESIYKNDLHNIQFLRVGGKSYEVLINGSKIGDIYHSGSKNIGFLFNNMSIDVLKEVNKKMFDLEEYEQNEYKTLLSLFINTEK